MLQNKKKKSLRGMTLIEVIIAMVVIILVTIIAYIGVSASAGFISEGADLRKSDVDAALKMEDILHKPDGITVTTVIEYDVLIRESVTDADKQPTGKIITETAEGSQAAGVVTASEGKVRYDMFVTCPS